MDSDEVAAVVAEVTALVNEHYVDPAAAVQITRALAASLAGGRYAADEQSLAAAVTADLQSVNGDKHLRLVYHAAPLPASEHGDDAAEYAAMASWADRTGHGIARVEWLTGNIAPAKASGSIPTWKPPSRWPAPSARSPAATGKAAASRPTSAPPPETRRTGPTSWRSTTSPLRPAQPRPKQASGPPPVMAVRRHFGLRAG
jgi:hypothetical protein